MNKEEFEFTRKIIADKDAEIATLRDLCDLLRESERKLKERIAFLEKASK